MKITDTQQTVLGLRAPCRKLSPHGPKNSLGNPAAAAHSQTSHSQSIHSVQQSLKQQRSQQVDISAFTTAENIRNIDRKASRARGKIKDQGYPQLKAQHCDVKLTQKLLPLSAETKFTPRKTGLKAALQNFETRLQEAEPSLYAACRYAADHLSPLQKIPDMVYCFAAHQSEEHLTNLIDQIAKQSLAKQQNLAIFIFLNGDEPKAKIAELNKKLTEHPDLDVRLITARVAKGNWHMGLKSLCSNTALLTVAKSLKGEDHKDIALAFGDADILAYSEMQHLEKQSEHISKGGLVMEGSYRNDLDKLFARHVNIGVANVYWEAIGKIQKQLRLQGTGLARLLERPPSFHMPGGNSSCSMILAALSGGIPSHTKYFDDVAFASTMKDLLAKSHSIKDMRTFLTTNAGNSLQSATRHFVLTDGGALIRGAEHNLPIPQAFASHDPNLIGHFQPLDDHQPKQLNEERLREDLGAIFQPIIGEIALFNVHNSAELWNNAATRELNKHMSIFQKEIKANWSKISQHADFQIKLNIVYPRDNTSLPKICVTINGEGLVTEYTKNQTWLKQVLAKKLSKQTPAQS